MLSYSITDLGALGSGSSYPLGLNNAGQVVGYSNLSATSVHAFLYSDGTMTDLGTLGGNISYAYGINDLGWVAGYSSGPGFSSHAVLWKDGTPTDLGTLSGNTSYAYAINRAGMVVGGSSFPGSGVYDLHAFLDHRGTLGDLGTLGVTGNNSVAYGINDAGQVVGYSQHAFLYSDGAMTDLGTLPGGSVSDAFAINNAGQVVGQSQFAGGGSHTHAFLYSDGEMADLGTLQNYGLGDSRALGVNDAGQVVGAATYLYNYAGTHAFVYNGGAKVTDLNQLIPPDSGWDLGVATAINDEGQIVAYGSNPEKQAHACLLTPDDASAVSGRPALDPLAAQALVAAHDSQVALSLPLPSVNQLGAAPVISPEVNPANASTELAANHRVPRPDSVVPRAQDMLLASADFGKPWHEGWETLS